MYIFHYTAYNNENKELTGAVEAHTQSEALKKISDLGLANPQITGSEKKEETTHNNEEWHFEWMNKDGKKVHGSFPKSMSKEEATQKLQEEYALTDINIQEEPFASPSDTTNTSNDTKVSDAKNNITHNKTTASNPETFPILYFIKLFFGWLSFFFVTSYFVLGFMSSMNMQISFSLKDLFYDGMLASATFAVFVVYFVLQMIKGYKMLSQVDFVNMIFALLLGIGLFIWHILYGYMPQNVYLGFFIIKLLFLPAFFSYGVALSGKILK